MRIFLPPELESSILTSGMDVPAPFSCCGLIDTGASLTCICSSLLDGIGLSPSRYIPLRTASHSDLSIPIYRVRIGLPDQAWAADHFNVGALEFSGQDFDALIGRDLLQYCQLLYDGPAGRFSFSAPA